MAHLRFLLIAAFIIACAGCKKSDGGGGTGSGSLWLTSVREGHGYGDATAIAYNPDGTIRSIGGTALSYFNNGQVMDYIQPTDTVVLDSANRLRYMKTAFESSGRQTRWYFYDGAGRVVRTVTNTGNGIDYLQELVYQNGDVVDMVYSIGGNPPNPDHFTFTFYDTLCVDQYPGLYYWGQLGMTQNKHLMKSMTYEKDTTFFSYLLDSNKRVLAAYRDYDNSGWTYSRAVDTSYYVYSRQ